VQTATILGVSAQPVQVEVSAGGGLPGIYIVGMPDTAINEARFRVRLALKAAGFKVGNEQLVVNLAPGSIRKTGSGFDLPIALGILIATGQLPQQAVDNLLCVGELSIDGSLRSSVGLLAYEKLAYDCGLGLLSGPCSQGVYPPQMHTHLCLQSLGQLKAGEFQNPDQESGNAALAPADFCDVAGNALVKRALQIAAAGRHAIFLVGPPGSGKSMLASRLPSILPPLSEDERIESAMIHSVAGLPYESILQGHQPFRNPHHNASKAGLLGGGTPVGPGEVSLAHNGVLFLDEMPEFGSNVLQLLRQPIESGKVTLARANSTITLPASIMLVGAANPCPCGYYGDPHHSCRCSEQQIANYLSRIGGPLMDRFDMVVNVQRSDPELVLATGSGISSHELRLGVEQALAFRRRREAVQGQGQISADSPDALEARPDTGGGKGLAALEGAGSRLLASCELGSEQRRCLEDMSKRFMLSGRGIMRALAVSRTIADLEQSRQVQSEHLYEAVTFRFENGGFR